jgi:hypothetical protein
MNQSLKNNCFQPFSSQLHNQGAPAAGPLPNNAHRSSLDARNVGVNESTNQHNDNNPIQAIAMLQVCYLPCPDKYRTEAKNTS